MLAATPAVCPPAVRHGSALSSLLSSVTELARALALVSISRSWSVSIHIYDCT